MNIEFSTDHIRERIRRMPMAVVSLSLALGILFSEYVEISVWLWVVLALCSAAIALRYRAIGTSAVCISLFALGALLHTLSQPDPLPYGERLRLQLAFDGESRLREGYCSATARISSCNGSRCRSGVVVYTDTTLLFNAGDRAEVIATLHPFKSHHRSYASLMYHRGYVGSVNISLGQIESVTYSTSHSLHERAVLRLRSLLPRGDARAVVMAMGAGSKAEIDTELTASYSRTGASHLLAVSGLHVGIVFMLINLLLTPLVLAPAGNIIRSLLAILAIWAYVGLCGMAPSAIRAAIMFSLLQLSLNSTREYLSGNILAGTASLMLLFNPNLIFDISFCLSFTAVAGIIFWGVPLLRLLHIRIPIVRQVVELLVIGLVSSLAVLPQVSHTFGIIPIVGLLLNPAVILTANLILLPTILSLLTPLHLAGGLLRVAEWAALLQNYLVGKCASLPFASIDYSFSIAEMAATYALFFVATLLSLGFRRSKKVRLPKI
ncbi:MAG: ComEC/Rec2 family competence protein [Alistipes sp.]|nr:ComEC/Rec2 family competence protein [Alistipes sp.]